ncbi:MAG TPA: electron transfer flavoprotein subunit alpha/FixB family protein [Roseiflexaceae bacterium]
MILGLIEHDRGNLNGLSLEMLTFGRGLAQQLDAPLHAVLVGAAARPLADRLAAYGVSAVYLADHERLDEYAPEAWAQSLVELIAREQPQVVLAPGSDRGGEVLAHVAARADLPLAANCTAAQPGDPFVVTRQRWGGSLLEEAQLRAPVKLLTVAPHAVAAAAAPAPADLTIHTFTPALADKDFRVRVTQRVATAAGAVSLADARVVVGGGRGVGSAEGFKALEELAAELGAAVGCSRAVTSQGWRPHADQIGQTGTRIAPELYIACGVSGAIQHLVGCKGAKRILAINTDREAPIVAYADYAIVGDLHEVVPALCAELRRAKGSY